MFEKRDIELMNKIKAILLAIAVLCFFICAYFAGRAFNHSSVQISSVSSTKTIKDKAPYAKSSSKAVSSSTSRTSEAKLDYKTITPMQTAAAIAYYGQHKVGTGIWKDIFAGSTDLDLYQNDNADGLNVKGRGNSWMLHPSNEGGGHMATYTVGADGEVAFYDVSAVNEDDDKNPSATINLRDIINYVNEQGAVDQIKDKAQHIHLQQ